MVNTCSYGLYSIVDETCNLTHRWLNSRLVMRLVINQPRVKEVMRLSLTLALSGNPSNLIATSLISLLHLYRVFYSKVVALSSSKQAYKLSITQ